MKTCICNSSNVVTECDRCLDNLCRICSTLVLGKKAGAKVEIIHKKCLRKKERLQ
jgi:hypothetical protein